MQDFIQFISSGNGLILASAVGATLLPQPFDFIHFLLQNYLYDRKYTLSRFKYEILQFVDWYLIDSFYFSIILLISWIFGLNNIDGTVLYILGAGAVLGVVINFLVKKYKK